MTVLSRIERSPEVMMNNGRVPCLIEAWS
jgi:hypothetical protein